jgi:hypothetical protein
MMAVQLAKAAAQAEKLRVEALVKRQARRSVYAGVGVAFSLGVFALLHVAVELAFAPSIGALQVTILLAVVDMFAAAILFSVAARSRPGKIEIEAEYLRRRALSQLKGEMSFVALLPALVGPRRFRQVFFIMEFVSRFLRRKPIGTTGRLK